MPGRLWFTNTPDIRPARPCRLKDRNFNSPCDCQGLREANGRNPFKEERGANASNKTAIWAVTVADTIQGLKIMLRLCFRNEYPRHEEARLCASVSNYYRTWN